MGRSGGSISAQDGRTSSGRLFQAHARCSEPPVPDGDQSTACVEPRTGRSYAEQTKTPTNNNIEFDKAQPNRGEKAAIAVTVDEGSTTSHTPIRHHELTRTARRRGRGPGRPRQRWPGHSLGPNPHQLHRPRKGNHPAMRNRRQTARPIVGRWQRSACCLRVRD
jgi:hypothetical protein